MIVLLELLAVVALLAIVVLLIRVLLVLREIHSASSSSPTTKSRSSPIPTVVVLGSGGHTTEILQLLQSLNPSYYTPLTFIVAQTDTTSLKRVEAAASAHRRHPDAVHSIPRSREVGQSYSTSVATTIWSLIYTLSLMMKLRPGLLLCNGPGTCLPIAVWTFVGRVLGLWEGKIVFCESFCRVTR